MPLCLISMVMLVWLSAMNLFLMVTTCESVHSSASSRCS